MAPRTTDLGEIITYDRLGDYYLKEIILMRARSLAPPQLSKAQPKNPFYFDRLPVSTSLQMFKKERYRHTSIVSKMNILYLYSKYIRKRGPYKRMER